MLRLELATGNFVAAADGDMRGSTTLAENLDPHRLSIVLTAFRRRVMRIARLKGGVVDRFLGDTAPSWSSACPSRGRTMPFERSPSPGIMSRSSPAGTSRRTAIPAIRNGIGIHSGDLFSAGIIGEDRRLEFTRLGDTVNVAARLEQATKAHGVPIPVSGTGPPRAAGSEAGRWRKVSRAPLRRRAEAMAYVAPAEPDAALDLGVPMPRRAGAGA